MLIGHLNAQRVLKGGMPKAKSRLLHHKPTHKTTPVLGDNGDNAEVGGSCVLLTKINERANNQFAALACSP
jgi:hypothetical protein